jgi:HEAT repeats
VSDARAEALLKSALEKIVYFEARSGQLEGDAAAARAEVERLKAELGSAAVREVELRQALAELEVNLSRTHRDREELGRTVEALRTERTALLDKLLDAARIRGVLSDEDGSFDLAAFISQLRSEVLAARGVPVPETQGAVRGEPGVAEPDFEEVPIDDAVAFQAEVARQMAHGVWGESSEAPLGTARRAEGVPARPPPPNSVQERPEPEARAVLQLDEGPSLSGWAPAAAHRRQAPEVSEVMGLAESLHAQGRLGAPSGRQASARRRLPGDDTLYGFSVRELSAPDAGARVRAAERLGALGDRAAASAVARALHAEREPRVAVAFLEALRLLAGPEGAPLVEPFVDAPMPEVRIAALRTLLTLDASRAVPQLLRAARDADPSVRRRAALLGLQLPGKDVVGYVPASGAEADPEVRRVAALAAGAQGGKEARATLLAALDDPFPAVRQAAARSLSRLLGVEVEGVAGLEGPQRRREIRRLTSLPVASVKSRAQRALLREMPAQRANGQRVALAVEEEVQTRAVGPSPEALLEPVLSQLQTSMRGCSLSELVQLLAAPPEAVEVACALLTARGQVVRRGTKLFVA